MKINEIVDPKPITLEGAGLDAIGALMKSGSLGNYLNDRKVIMVGKKVAKAFGLYMGDIRKQSKASFGKKVDLKAKEAERQRIKVSEPQTGMVVTGSDGQDYTWKGAQWVSNSTGKIAKKEIANKLTQTVATSESLEKLGDIMLLTEEENQQIVEEVVLQELIPALAALGAGAGALARGAASAVGAVAKTAGKAIGTAGKAAGQAIKKSAKAGVAGAKRAGSAIKKGIKQAGQEIAANLAAGAATSDPDKKAQQDPNDLDGDGDADSSDYDEFQRYVADFTRQKVFMQSLEHISNQDIKNEVINTIKTMKMGEKNQEQWIKLVALSQQNSAVDPAQIDSSSMRQIKTACAQYMQQEKDGELNAAGQAKLQKTCSVAGGA